MGNVKSQWKCLFNCSHKYLVESHSQNKGIGVLLYVLQQEHNGLCCFKEITFYLRTKCCVTFILKRTQICNELFALSIISKYVTGVILLVLLEIGTLHSFFDASFSKIMILESLVKWSP